MNQIRTGDCRSVMRELIAEGVRVNCVVSSPPYWALRSYDTPPQIWGGDESCAHAWGGEHKIHRTGGDASSGLADYDNGLNENTVESKVARRSFDASSELCSKCGAWRGELGLEPDPFLYVEHMVEVFRLVRDLMADDAVCFLNIGDTYITRPTKSASLFLNGNGTARAQAAASYRTVRQMKNISGNLKMKDMALVPQRLAIALQDDGWWIRQDIVWAKPNPMPSSTKDRFTTAHEYLWMLAKSERYFFDQEAVKEPASPNSHARMARAHGGVHAPGQDPHGGILAPRPNRKNLPEGQSRLAGFRDAQRAGVNPKARDRRPGGWAEGDVDHKDLKGRYPRSKQNASFSAAFVDVVEFRNKRSVWTIPTSHYTGSHYATFPEALVEPCVLAGSRVGDIIFDPFMGTGTVAKVAQRFGRRYLGCDLDAKNEALQRERIGGQTVGMAFA